MQSPFGMTRIPRASSMETHDCIAVRIERGFICGIPGPLLRICIYMTPRQTGFLRQPTCKDISVLGVERLTATVVWSRHDTGAQTPKVMDWRSTLQDSTTSEA